MMAETVSKCPTCGRFVSNDEGYGDAPPGGRRGLDFLAVYCGEDCARRKSPPARCEAHGAEFCAACGEEEY